ncbi:hypothetical protein ACIQC5_12275 [Paenarthrobacter sp. NPDC092416]|uniref:YobI family P-loop NTPase n=1 Tax=Paenarthrobacter sp. NPDC092416 TaxID=3364386 RepID=UPI0037F5521B
MTHQNTESIDETDKSIPENPNLKIRLRSLAPEFNAKHHSVYVRHLEQAVQDKKNRNIALTGRYGAGKSSVLDEFEKKHRDATVRVSINTLGPDEDDEDLTNRIQKELVKQLVYRLKPGQLRRSRFARPKPLTVGRAFTHALGVTTVLLTLLWLFGVRPAKGWPGDGLTPDAQVLLGTAFFGLVLCATWGIRWLIGDRIVSEVTTAGTKIALGDEPTTYFDSFLGEIVAFFDAVEPDYVIFEDLDRFDDPQIFDSLRELNTLINSSALWKDRAMPLRFIYAIKDSLFERLGAEAPAKTEALTEDEGKKKSGSTTTTSRAKPDLAGEAVRRANRTKFFELVVPIVPFLSHRNARDHLEDALSKLGFPEDFVSRSLLDLVARHTTDMRLMINICNEFAVFVERLLWTDNPAPGMTADHLFALVVYKNFHLADFEEITQRTSSLDVLERHHRDDVRDLVKDVQTRRSARTRTEEQRRRKIQTAKTLGERLRQTIALLPATPGRTYESVAADGETFSLEETDKVEFWERLALSKTLAVRQNHTNNVVTATEERLNALFPEVMSNSSVWLDPEPAELARLLRQYDEDIAWLKGADFSDLAQYERVPGGRVGFDQRIADSLKSDLARDLVRGGFVTRNYAEYSAVFIGSFIGVDVAYFYNHSVQPNEMYLDFEFETENAVSNLLEQVPEDFTSRVSVLNLQVASFLLTQRPSQAKQLGAYIVRHNSTSEVRAFLDAYLSMSAADSGILVRLLAEHPWSGLFDYLANHAEVPDEGSRLRLIDIALLYGKSSESYVFGEAAAELIRSSHPQLTAITEDHDSAHASRLLEVLKSVGLVVTDLDLLGKSLRDRVVAAQMYEIKVSNLKLALGIETAPTLGEVRKERLVWDYCRARISGYLTAIDDDDSIEHVIQTEQVLIEVVNEEHDSWTVDQLRAVLERCAPTAMVTDIVDIPELIWPVLVRALVMTPTVANIAIYERKLGIDEHISALLSHVIEGHTALQDVETVDEEERLVLAVSLLNASLHLAAPDRVKLVSQLGLSTTIDISQVTPKADQLLAYGLHAGVFPDDLLTFEHFARGGWNAVSAALEASAKIESFISPSIVTGFVCEFLESPETPEALKLKVLNQLDQFVPMDDARTLRAAGKFACEKSIRLSLDDVRRIAHVTKSSGAVLRQLVLSKDQITTSDLVGILVTLGAPYDTLAAGPGAEFDLPSASSSETLMRRLERDGHIEIVKKPKGRGRKVVILV